EEPRVAFRDELAEGHEVRVVQALERAELALEARDRLRRRVAQDLDRDVLAALRVERLVHLAHSAFADLAQDLESIGRDGREHRRRPKQHPAREEVVSTSGRAWPL